MSNKVHVNGIARKSLAEQIDRLDGILDGLAEGLVGAVSSAVREALAPALRVYTETIRLGGDVWDAAWGITAGGSDGMVVPSGPCCPGRPPAPAGAAEQVPV